MDLSLTIKLKKVTRADDEIVCAWEVTDDGFPSNRNVSFTEAPLPSFDGALQALRHCLPEILMVTPAWADSCKVKGITVTRTKAGDRSAAITAQVDVPYGNVPFTFRTPATKVDNPQDGSLELPKVLSKESAERIDSFLREAEKYIRGERLQIQLPLDTEDDSSPDEQMDDVDEDDDDEKGVINFGE